MQGRQGSSEDIKAGKVKEGFLMQRSRVAKEWRKRWVVLSKNGLYCFEQEGNYERNCEKIQLKDISTIKSFYKNQYERGQVFRVESVDCYFYLSGSDHQEKWAWITAIERTTEMIRNPALKDAQQVIRESLRISTAARQSSIRQSVKGNKGLEAGTDFMKLLRLKLQSHILEVQVAPSQLEMKEKEQIDCEKEELLGKGGD